MHHLPTVKSVVVNRHSSSAILSGSFIDAEYVFHYIASGTWLFRMGQRQYTVPQGALVLLPPRLLHVVHPLASRGEHDVIRFEIHEPSPALLQAPLVLQPPASVGRLVRREFLAMLAASRRPKPFDSLWLSGVMTQLLALYLRHAGHATESAVVSMPLWPRIEQAVRFIQQRYASSSLDLPEMAAAADLSLSHFCRIFRQYTGRTPHRYLTEFRIERAQIAMLSASMTCTAAATACGFDSVHVFSKAFRRTTGQSPKQWLIAAGR